MVDWKKLVDQQNAKTYSFPSKDGWETREAIAEELGCSPEKVHATLRPALSEGVVEKQEFPVWDPKLKRLIRVTGYRKTRETEVAPAAGTENAQAVERYLRNHPKATLDMVKREARCRGKRIPAKEVERYWEARR